METRVKEIREIIQDQTAIPTSWQAKVVINDENMTYVVWNEDSKEALVIDPMKEDWEVLLSIVESDLKYTGFLQSSIRTPTPIIFLVHLIWH